MMPMAGGRQSASIWDRKTETFIKQCLQCLEQDETQEWQEFDDADVEEPMSAMSATSSEPIEVCRHCRRRKNNVCTVKPASVVDYTDIADIADVGASTSELFSPSPNWQEVPEGVVIPPGADVRMDMTTGKNFARWPDGADTVGLNRSSGISEPEPGDLVGKDPGESIMDGHYLVQCGWCQHFSPSPVQGGRTGSCRLYPKSSWNGKPFQAPDNIHPCPSFEAKDSIKVLAAGRPYLRGWGRH